VAGRPSRFMKITLRDGLPFVTASVSHRGRKIAFRSVLLDTGSAGTLFATDAVSVVGLTYEPEDRVHRIRGVGGAEGIGFWRVAVVRLWS
jgi:hypothetical protein